VADCCECGDELAGSGATELVSPTIRLHLYFDVLVLSLK
jgi:hypothetical protein